MSFQLALSSWEEEVLKRRLSQDRLSGCSGEPRDVYGYTPGKGGSEPGRYINFILSARLQLYHYLFFPPRPRFVSVSALEGRFQASLSRRPYFWCDQLPPFSSVLLPQFPGNRVSSLGWSETPRSGDLLLLLLSDLILCLSSVSYSLSCFQEAAATSLSLSPRKVVFNLRAATPLGVTRTFSQGMYIRYLHGNSYQEQDYS